MRHLFFRVLQEPQIKPKVDKIINFFQNKTILVALIATME